MLAVRRAAPFDDAESNIAWFGSHAAVWYWSASRIRALAGPLPPRARIHAEAPYRGAIRDDGVELLDLAVVGNAEEHEAGGFEARLWRQGHLAASRWWPSMPPDPAWQVFLRGSGIPPGVARPGPQLAGLHERPLGGGRQGSNLAGQLQAQWPLFATGAGCIVAAAFCWQLGGVARAYSENSRIEARIGQLESRLDSVISARNLADDAAATIESLLALRPPASQTRLLAEVVNITPAGDWSIALWQQPGPETLEVTLKGRGLDATSLVNAWEQSPLLQDVTPVSSNRPDELVLQARLSPVAGSRP